MKTVDDVIDLAKTLVTKHGGLNPTILIDGTSGSTSVPLPAVEEHIKLSVLEALGATIANDGRLGELRQVFLLAEGWRSATPYRRGLPTTQPRYAPDRVEVLMVVHHDLRRETKRMVLYDLVRHPDGTLAELRAFTRPHPSSDAVASPPIDALVRGFTRASAAKP